MLLPDFRSGFILNDYGDEILEPDGEGRRASITLTEERIQSPGATPQQLLGQDQGPAIQ